MTPAALTTEDLIESSISSCRLASSSFSAAASSKRADSNASLTSTKVWSAVCTFDDSFRSECALRSAACHSSSHAWKRRFASLTLRSASSALCCRLDICPSERRRRAELMSCTSLSAADIFHRDAPTPGIITGSRSVPPRVTSSFARLPSASSCLCPAWQYLVSALVLRSMKA